MSKKRILYLGVFISAFLQFAFTLNDVLPRKIDEMNEKVYKKIENSKFGYEEGFAFRSFRLTLGEAVIKLKTLPGDNGNSKVSVLGYDDKKFILQHDTGNEEMNYFLSCKRNRCSVDAAMILMKPTREVFPLPKENAVLALEKNFESTSN